MLLLGVLFFFFLLLFLFTHWCLFGNVLCLFSFCTSVSIYFLFYFNFLFDSFGLTLVIFLHEYGWFCYHLILSQYSSFFFIVIFKIVSSSKIIYRLSAFNRKQGGGAIYLLHKNTRAPRKNKHLDTHISVKKKTCDTLYNWWFFSRISVHTAHGHFSFFTSIASRGFFFVCCSFKQLSHVILYAEK